MRSASPLTVAEAARMAGARATPADPAAGGVGDGLAAGVLDVSHDSRRVTPGCLYAAMAGARSHGAAYARQAVAAGAVAVLTDPAGAALAGPLTVPVLVHPEPRAVLGALADEVHHRPSADVLVVGVTGTNGKTTVTWMLQHMLSATGTPCGVVGTLGCLLGGQSLPGAAGMTTPEAPDLHRMLARLREHGARAVALEVSSHALSQHRVGGVRMAAAGFTNLSRDHLDYHGDMAAYLAAKEQLFTAGYTGRAVVCVDGAAGRQVAVAAAAAGLDTWSLTAGDGVAATAEPAATAAVTIVEALDKPDGGQSLRVRGPFGAGGSPLEVPVDLPMPGRHNAANAAMALALAVHALGGRGGGEPAALARALADLPQVPGRMERIVAPGGPGPRVFVDFAHTPEAITSALQALRPTTPGLLVAVIGAGGGRDAGKRAGMGAAAAQVADVVVVTDDNPRGEEPAGIRAAVLAGAVSTGTRRAGDVVEVPDRRGAIARALANCSGPADTVVVAGKGHETGQQYGEEILEFDDRVEARAALESWIEQATPVGVATC